MIQIRRSDERGKNHLDWLDSQFTFSFDQYHDPRYMGFRSLRVINEDHVAPNKGFGMHPHRDMEILTWMLEGSLTNRDSMGHAGVIRPGELQHMSAGTGVLHSEWNASEKDEAHLLQIWILPDHNGLTPEYEQLAFSPNELRGQFALLAGPNAPVTIHQDANLHGTRLQTGETATFELKRGRYACAQVALGAVLLNGEKFGAGDGAAVSGERQIVCEAIQDSQLLLFDLA
jgi:redox-sensitive bicupin YhaK (pirin superfamily)